MYYASACIKHVHVLCKCMYNPSTCIMQVHVVLSKALVAERVPETLTKEKQKLIINKSSCEQDNCESVGCGLQPNISKGTDNTVVNMLTTWKNGILRNMLRRCRIHLM